MNASTAQYAPYKTSCLDCLHAVHHGVLPYTGLSISTIIILGILLVMLGWSLRNLIKPLS